MQSTGKEDIAVSLADAIQNSSSAAFSMQQSKSVGSEMPGASSVDRSSGSVSTSLACRALFGVKIVCLPVRNRREQIGGKSILGNVAFPFSIVSYIHLRSSVSDFWENFRNGGLRQRYRSLAKFRQSKREAHSRQCCTFLFSLICPAISGTYPSSRK